MSNRTAYWREYQRKRRSTWTPEQKEAHRDRVRAWQGSERGRYRLKITRAARDEARERGVPTSVIREEWRVT
jgi:hypothetical protein